MKIQAQRGTEDVLPNQVEVWQYLESSYSKVARTFGYSEIRTPVFEDVNLFTRTSGEFSDIVSKEMYDFKDKGDRHIALKPEGTAPVMRATIEHNLAPLGNHTRLYYITPCYRYGRPQKGRLRELHQLGAELIGSSSAEADCEILEFAYAFLKEISLDGHPIMINSIGRSECRLKYSEVILNHLESFLKDVEDGVRLRIQKNPLGVLDTKDEVLQRAIEGVPSILNFLEDESKQRFDTLQELLVEAGIPFVVSPEIVRGLDYYTETVFEFVHPLLPGISAFAGGRYDNLIKQLGGSLTPSVGFGMGMERLILALEANGRKSSLSSPQVFVVCASQSARSECRKLIRNLRSEGIISGYDLDNRSLKSQMRQADSSGAEFALIIGEDEIANKTVTVRNLRSGSQELVSRTKVVDSLVNPNGSSCEENGL